MGVVNNNNRTRLFCDMRINLYPMVVWARTSLTISKVCVSLVCAVEYEARAQRVEEKTT